VNGIYLDADRAVVPVKIGGRLVGVFELGSAGNRFRAVSTDSRGTVIGDRDGANLSTPFGVRRSHPELAAALDFVEQGFDAERQLHLPIVWLTSGTSTPTSV
jgi:hypothetical protein